MEPTTLWLEAVLIVVLIAVNGFFSAAEIAVVSVRKSRVAQLVEEGRRGAAVVAELKEEPANFLATVQVGVTIVGSMASVLGGAAAPTVLEPLIRRVPIPILHPWAGVLALAVTVLVISYLTLVVGELAPKSLALRKSEGLACLTAPIIRRVSRVFAPAIHVLTWSTSALLRVLGSASGTPQQAFSEEELKQIVTEGTHQGIFDEAEQELIHSVFEFTDTSVREVMVPRADIRATELDTPPAQVLDELLATGMSRFPVYRQDLDHIVGIVHVKDLLARAGKEAPSTLAEAMHSPLFVPDSIQISDLLRDLQSRRGHMAIVINEFGTVIGLATIEDLLEEIVGEIRDEFDRDEELPVQHLADGSLLVDGSVPLNELHDTYGLPLEETQDYRTMAGFVFGHLRRIPRSGEAFTHEGLHVTIVTIDGGRIRKVRIERQPQSPRSSDHG